MKNKYQEALDWLMEGNDSCGTEWDLLQELIDRQHPVKVLIDEDFFLCSDCGRCVLKLDGYCWHCGQKLDWGEERPDVKRPS